VLTAFKPTYIAARAMDFINLIVASEDDGIKIKKLKNIVTCVIYNLKFRKNLE